MSSREEVVQDVIKQNISGMMRDGDCICPIHTANFFLVMGLIIARTDPQVGQALEDGLATPLDDEAEEVKGWAEVDQMVAGLREELKVE